MKKKADKEKAGFIERFCSAQEHKARISLIVAAAVVVTTFGTVCAASLRFNNGSSIPSDNMELNAAENYLAQAAMQAGASESIEFVDASQYYVDETTESSTNNTKRGGLTGGHIVSVDDLKSLSDDELMDAILSGKAGLIDRSNIDIDQSQNQNAGHTASGGNVSATDTPTPVPTSSAPGIKLSNTSLSSTAGETINPLDGVSVRTWQADNVTSGISYDIKDSSGQSVSLEKAQETPGKYNITYSYELESANPPTTMTSYELGIDISEFQAGINWNAVRNDGITFAFIRCGGRGYSLGGIYDDSRFYENVRGAKAAGIKVGVYFFSQAITPYEALEEASVTLNKISGLGIDLPVVMDWETASYYRTWNLYGQDFANVITAFCSTIAQNGYTPCVYLNTSDINNRLGSYSGEILSKYKLWYAYPYSCYSDGSFYQDGDMTPPRSFYYEYWQYSWHGDVAGVSTDCDLNIRILGKTTVGGETTTITATAEWEVTAPPEPSPTVTEPTVTDPTVTDPTGTDPTDNTDPTGNSDPSGDPTPTGDPEDPNAGNGNGDGSGQTDGNTTP